MSDQVPNPQLPSAIAPGWYPDPQMVGTQRYWDGNAWTEHRTATPPQIVRATNGLAIAALVLGIAGDLFVGFTTIPFLLGLFAIIFGGIGQHRAKKLPGDRGGAMSIWGIVLGCLAIGATLTRIIVGP